jgi:hypothetical protein
MNNIQTLAKEASAYMTTDTRPNGERFYKTTDNCPDWFSDLVREAHGEMMPDDYRYRFISEALDAFADYDDTDSALEQIEADCYTYNLIEWLGSNLTRQYYTDEALENGAPDTFAMLYNGQAQEKDEVYRSVLQSLETQLEELTEEA